MMEIAQEKDIPRLREIWKACFGDPDSYLDFYYAQGFPKFQTLIDRQEGEISSMLTVVPSFYKKEGECFDAAYLYAVGTAPEWRGKGIASRLLADAHDYLRNTGVKVATLFPAEESLYRFYEKAGYQTGFSVCEVKLEKEDCIPENAVIRPCERDLFLEESADFLNRQPVAMKFASKSRGYFYDEVLATGGQVLWISTDALQGYAVCYKIEKTVVLKETSLSRSQLEACGASLMDWFGADRLFARIPAEQGNPTVRHGMLCVLDGEWGRLWPEEPTGYMNLILD